VVITKIERLPKSPVLYNLYSEESLLFAVTEDTLTHFNLQKGIELTDEELETIFDYDRVRRCVHQAFRYLSRRNHFEAELKRKLFSKGFKAEIISKALEYLKEKKYLDDQKLTAQFVREAIKLKHYGPMLLKKKLFERGVNSEEIEIRLNEFYPFEKQEEIAGELVRKKLKSLPENLGVKKRNQKIAAFLQQKGFGWDVINALLRELPAE